MDFGGDDGDDISGGGSDGSDTGGTDTTDTGTVTSDTGGATDLDAGAHASDVGVPAGIGGEKGGLEGLSGSIEGSTHSSIESNHVEGTKSGPDVTQPFDTVTSKSLDEMNASAKEIAFSFAKERAPERANELDSRAKELPAPTLERFSDPNVLGTHNPRSHDVAISDLATNKAASHSLVHEYVHASSFNKSSSLETSETKMSVDRSGIRAIVYETNKATGEISMKDYHRAANEGITESRALLAEKAAGKEASIATYSTNRSYMSQLEKLVGSPAIDNAYYNGDLQGLSNKVNELSDEKGWSNFSHNLDVACSPKSTEEDRSAAKDALNNAIRDMAERKAELEKAAKEVNDIDTTGKEDT